MIAAAAFNYDDTFTHWLRVGILAFVIAVALIALGLLIGRVLGRRRGRRGWVDPKWKPPSGRRP